MVIYLNLSDSEENTELVYQISENFHEALGENSWTKKGNVVFQTADGYYRNSARTPNIAEHYKLLGMPDPPDRLYYNEYGEEEQGRKAPPMPKYISKQFFGKKEPSKEQNWRRWGGSVEDDEPKDRGSSRICSIF